MQKLTKITELRPPRAILEMSTGKAATQARRDWLDAQKKEQEALGHVAKITGIGSYQVVAVYKVSEVPSRDQVRGTCQACGGDVAIMHGVTSHHGYERPGYGYIIGDCAGVVNFPAEKSIDLAKNLHETALQDADRMEAHAAEIDAIDASGVERKEVTEARANVERVKAAEYPSHWDRNKAIDAATRAFNAAKHRADGLRSSAKSARAYAAFLVANVYPKLGQELRIVPIRT